MTDPIPPTDDTEDLGHEPNPNAHLTAEEPIDQAKPRRRRASSYAVLERREPNAPDGPVFVLIERSVEAPSGKEAIRAATAHRDHGDQTGTFWAVLARDYRPVTRSVGEEVVQTEDWS